MPQFDTIVETVEAVLWSGTNIADIVALVGMQRTKLDGGALSVDGKNVPVDNYVVKGSNGQIKEVVHSGAFGGKYTPHQP